MNFILVLLLGINLNIDVILSSSRHKISRILSTWFKMRILQISPDPLLYSGFSIRLMRCYNISSCFCLAVGAMIMYVVDIKYMLKC